jgi:hypothetical protein
LGIVTIACVQDNGVCSFKRAYNEIPNVVKLSAANRAPSKTRRGEPMWHQLVRNIKSHSKEPDNFIKQGFLRHVPRVGYAVTKKGRDL